MEVRLQIYRYSSLYKGIESECVAEGRRDLPVSQVVLADGKYIIFPDSYSFEINDDNTAECKRLCNSVWKTSDDTNGSVNPSPSFEYAALSGTQFYFAYNKVLYGMKEALDGGAITVNSCLRFVFAGSDFTASSYPGYSPDNVYRITAIRRDSDHVPKGYYLTLEATSSAGAAVTHSEIVLNEVHQARGSMTLTVYKEELFTVGEFFGNRLFCGEHTGRYLVISKYGDIGDFTYSGKDDGARSVFSLDPGKWTAIKEFSGSVYAFKHCGMFRVVGSGATNFSLEKIFDKGCIGADAVASSGGTMYFCAADGVYRYSGGEVIKMSKPLDGLVPRRSDCYSFEAKLGADSEKLYCSFRTRRTSTDTSFNSVLCVYDMRSGAWHTEEFSEGTPQSLLRLSDALYAGFGVRGVKRLGGGGGEGFAPGVSLITKNYFYHFDKKAIGQVYIRFSSASEVFASVSYDGGAFIGRIAVNPNGGIGLAPFRLKKCNTFRIKLEGSGEVKIYDIEFALYRGGR